MTEPQSATLEEATTTAPAEGKQGGPRGHKAEGTPARPGANDSPTRAPSPGPLPTARTKPSGSLADKTILIYGAPKIGKSTLASEFGRVLFADTEGGLGDLEVYRQQVTSWQEFLGLCAAYAESDFDGIVIDTVDLLSVYCSDYTNAKLGIVHESDLDWGKGWSVKEHEFARAMAKLASLPGKGLILISHSKDVEIKQRNRTIMKVVPDLTGAAREVCVGLADLILFADFEGEGDEERRVLRTKPSAFYEAGERGKTPRLPATIDLSHEALVAAWTGGKND